MVVGLAYKMFWSFSDLSQISICFFGLYIP
jgi:hypothetical protein